MADFPAMPLWTDAYLADTRHLTTLEHGAYLLLLMEAWRRPDCSLPDDDKMLARLSGCTAEEWATIKDAVLDFWHRDGRSKTITQKRLKKEREYVLNRSKSQRDKIVKRWNKTKKDDTAVLPKAYRNDTPTPTPINNKYGDFLGGIRGTIFIPSTSDEYAAWHDWARKQGFSLPNVNGGYWFKSKLPPESEAA